MMECNCSCHLSMLVGPFGDHDDQQVFVQKVVPDTDRLFVRHSCSGKRLSAVVLPLWNVFGDCINHFCCAYFVLVLH